MAPALGKLGFVFGLIMVFRSCPRSTELSAAAAGGGRAVAVLGALLAIWLRGLDNDVYSRSAGSVDRLAAKNAILIVEFASQPQQGIDELRHHGRPAELRPIYMTSLLYHGVLPLTQHRAG